jgi:hypothetical protein
MESDMSSEDLQMQATEMPAQEHARIKVLAIHFDPIDDTGQPLSKRYQWNEVRNLTWQHTSDMYFSSGGAVAYDVVAMRTVREFPPMLGEPFTLESYHSCLGQGKSCIDATRTDYTKLIYDEGLCSEIASEYVDEVWLFGGPGFGFYESRMIGPGAFHVNSAPLFSDAPTSECTRPFLIMGFAMQRTNVEMLHNFGHRVDHMLAHYAENPVRGFDPETASLFMRPKSGIGFAGCGTTHHPPNAATGEEQDRHYGLKSDVASLCDSVGPVPNPGATARLLDCREWFCQESPYHRWRFLKLPRTLETNWWRLFFPRATWQAGAAQMPKPLPPAVY